jgi:rhamnose utilization protein RhaD (predicted bifunctional aldolase and dehydrogenase)
MEKITKTFSYVNYLWDRQKISSLGDNQVDFFYTVQIYLGANLRITNYGSGNTSCRTIEKNP